MGVAGKLRSADCVAKGKVTAVVLSKHDFADLDNPLLSWMLDYDAVANVLKVGQCSQLPVQLTCYASMALTTYLGLAGYWHDLA